MNTTEAIRALKSGQTVRMICGDGPEDPIILLTLHDEMVIAESVAGWSAGVVEPVCGIERSFLHEYIEDRPLSLYVDLSKDRSSSHAVLSLNERIAWTSWMRTNARAAKERAIFD